MLWDIAMATNFLTQFAVTGFVGYNFGCMVANDTQFDSRVNCRLSRCRLRRVCVIVQC